MSLNEQVEDEFDEDEETEAEVAAEEDESWLDELADDGPDDGVVSVSTSVSNPSIDLEGLAVVFEDRPVKVKRAPAKKELAWEEYLDFLKQKPGTTARVFLFTGDEASTKARSRARSMRSRMVKTQPQDLWEIVAEEIKADGSWKVFATYEGSAPADLVAKRAQIHADRVARGNAIAKTRFGK